MLWDAPLPAIDIDGLPLLATSLGDAAFFDELKRKHGMTVRYDGREVVSFRRQPRPRQPPR